MNFSFRTCFQRPNFLVNFIKLSPIYSIKYSTHEGKSRSIPKCIYVLPPNQWIKNKINFQRLRIYDNDFNEKEFKVGARQAVQIILDVARERDSAYLAKLTTLRGFSRIYRDSIASQNDPRRKLLYFNVQDIQKVVTTDVQIIETDMKFYCLVEVFFIGIKYLDDIVQLYQKTNPNVTLQIYQDIKNIEKRLKKKNYSETSQIPLSEKLLVTEGYVHLLTIFPQNEKDEGWKVDFFKISDFNIVHFKGLD